MTRKEFVHLSTRIAEDLTAWHEKAYDQYGLTEPELVALREAAQIIHRTAIRAAETAPDDQR